LTPPPFSCSPSLPTEKIFLHPQSVNFSKNYFPLPFLAFHDLMQTTKGFSRIFFLVRLLPYSSSSSVAFVMDTSMVPLFALLLFSFSQGGTATLRVYPAERVVVLGSGIVIRVAAKVAALVSLLQHAIDTELTSLFLTPTADTQSSLVLTTITHLIHSDPLAVIYRCK
jgi:hypothetical protein